MVLRINLLLDHFGGHARVILPTLSPSQPVIADDEIICWGTLPKFFAFFAFCDVLFVLSFFLSLFFSLLFRFSSHASTAVRFLFCIHRNSFFIYISLFMVGLFFCRRSFFVHE